MCCANSGVLRRPVAGPGGRIPGRRPSYPRGANLHASAPQTPAPLGLRHVAALEQLRGGPITISELASRLDLTLPTVSGVLADLDRAGLVDRHADLADGRRTIVQIVPAQSELAGQ